MRLSTQGLLRFPRGRTLAAAVAVGVGVAAKPLPAQQSIVAAVSAEWLQLGIGSLDRDTGPSMTWSIAHERPSGVRFELGYLRSAHERTTAEGVTAAVGLSLRHGRLTARPGVAVLLGAAEAAGVLGSGDVRRTTGGGALNLGAELRVLPMASLTASVRQWFFTSSVVRPDRNPTLVGLGVSLHPAASR
jgi:hypothetical protein